MPERAGGQPTRTAGTPPCAEHNREDRAGQDDAAQLPHRRDPVAGTVVTCEEVFELKNGDDIGLGFDLIRNVHQFYDDAGNLVKESRNVNYTGIFQNLSTGERYTFQGTRHVTFDFVAGTFTSTGNYRTVTQPGTGTVLHSAGREVFDLVNEVVLYSSGPKYDETSAGAASDICGLFGLTA